MPRKWADSGSGTILLRNINEEKPEHKKNADEIKAQNEVKKICLECVKETCSAAGGSGNMKNKTALMFFIIIGIFAYCLVLGANQPYLVSYESYIVEDGDTLWAIAAQSNGYGHIDTRRIIEDMGCDANIHKGDIINVPIYGGINE